MLGINIMAGESAILPVKGGFKVLSRSPADNFEKLSGMAALAHLASRLPLDLFMLAVLAVISFLIGGIIFPITTAVIILLLLADAAYSFLYVSGFVFTLEEKCVLVRKGVITYSFTLIPYENIQDVHLVQSITGRIFGVWSVIIFTATATSAGSEQVIGLRKENAERFKESIFQKIKEAKHVTD